MKLFAPLLLALSPFVHGQQDEYRHLEQIESEQSLNWVIEQNERSRGRLDTPIFSDLYEEALAALSNEDKLVYVSRIGDYYVQLQQSANSPIGRLMTTPAQRYLDGEPSWELIIDLDDYSAQRGETLSYAALDCLNDQLDRCLLELSVGGSDTHEFHEFNGATGEFIDDGFHLPAAKSSVTWVDKDHWVVGTATDEFSVTDSGYARHLRILQRGESIEQARMLYSASRRSVGVGSVSLNTQSPSLLITESTTFWTRDYFEFPLRSQLLKRINVPETARIEGKIGDQWVIRLYEDWQLGAHRYSSGSIVLGTSAQLRRGSELFVLFEYDHKNIVDEVVVGKTGILITSLRDVSSHAAWYAFDGDQNWFEQHLNLPANGAIAYQSIDANDELLVRYEDFLTPPSVYHYNPHSKALNLVEQQAPTFDSSNFSVMQHFATSQDGTQVPYYVIYGNDTVLDSNNPTHIFAYGGFRSSVTPSYSGSYEATNGAYGNLWLSRGGIYVIANIRGGGEYGPEWHAAALRENRHKAFEDFEAVAMDLQARKYTQPALTSIEGRSNGGLLTGAAITRRPDLYGAAIIGVPLLDMQRYHLLLAGASWVGEYGDPDSSDWTFIREYSPYQNVSADEDYPATFFYTSTKDDRVHPGHARKMAARMLSMGHEVDYYENLEGGHTGSVTNEQLAHRIALSYAFLWREVERFRLGR